MSVDPIGYFPGLFSVANGFQPASQWVPTSSFVFSPLERYIMDERLEAPGVFDCLNIPNMSLNPSPVMMTKTMAANEPTVFGGMPVCPYALSSSICSPDNTKLSAQRMKHYYNRHHVHGQQNGAIAKNKARFTYDCMRDPNRKISLSSAPSSPNAGSVGGSLGNNYTHTSSGAFDIQQCKASGNCSYSSGYSSKSSKLSACSSLSSYSSCSSLSSTSANGISPRKRRADDEVKRVAAPCRKEVINLCSCETCTTEDVTARVDDVTLRDAISDIPVQVHKRSKNDDDGVISSSEQEKIQGNRSATPKDRSTRSTRKSNKKNNRQVPMPSRHGNGNASSMVAQPVSSFPFVVPTSLTKYTSPTSAQDLYSPRYFLRSAVKANKEATQAKSSAAYGDDATQSLPAQIINHNVTRQADANDNGSRTSSPRYLTRSQKVKPEAQCSVSPAQTGQTPMQLLTHPQARPVPIQHAAHTHPATPKSTYQPATVIEGPTVNYAHSQPTQSTSSKAQSSSLSEADANSPRTSSLKKLYDIHGVIGVGGGGTVYSGTRKSDGLQVAIKQVPKAKVKRWGKLNDRVVPIEFELLYRASRSNHKGIISMVDWYERRTTYILIMERPQPVIDLFDYLNQYGALSEASARSIFKQIAEAVLHCHANGVVHRDIKDENIILNLHTGEAKLIDFGCGTVLRETPLTEFAGTPEFYPPEWFTHHRYYGHVVDAWSLGVLLFTMVEAEVPFSNEKLITECKIRHKRANVSNTCKSLITWMLQKDQEKRPNIQQVLSHPWFHMSVSSTPAGRNGVMGTDELYEKRLHQHQNAFTDGSLPHKKSSRESPQSPPR